MEAKEENCRTNIRHHSIGTKRTLNWTGLDWTVRVQVQYSIVRSTLAVVFIPRTVLP